MNKLISSAFALSMLLSCAHAPKGPVIKEGICMDSLQVFLLFTDPQSEEPAAVVPTQRGCRCSITVDGQEYVSTPTEEDYSKCQKKEETSSTSNETKL